MLDFIAAFMEKVERYQPDFLVRGIITCDNTVYRIGTDTKVISKVFELVVRPFVLEIASDHGLSVVEPKKQNYYPDFTLMAGESDGEKIAVDVKTTYRRRLRADGSWSASFTLGGYTSFLRNETKNIVFAYSQYARHYIVGFIYDRAGSTSSRQIFTLSELDQVPCPIRDVEFFVQEKYRIASERPGSGNTANIGSITGSSVVDFAAGKGPFAEAGEAVFVDYWRHYGTSATGREYRNLQEYWNWKQTLHPQGER